MPSRPSAACRRFHTGRIIAKRLGHARLLGWFDDRGLIRGRLDDEQWYLGCHRARCGVCHPEKRWSYGDRQRDEREWRRREESAWGEALHAWAGASRRRTCRSVELRSQDLL